MTGEGWQRVAYVDDVTYEDYIALVKALESAQFLVDLHVPYLLVFPPGTELHQHALYRSGRLILQDKASCLPPLVLAPVVGDHVLDACAAPGMKTSQLAALMDNSGSLVAVERDRKRFTTLCTLLRRAGVTNVRPLCGDFLRLRPADYPRVTAILLDPSCSGTGMVGGVPSEEVPLERLRRLASLQERLLQHALSFPAVRRVVYSTCSVTEQENEQVVAATLAAHPNWRLADAAPATWRQRGRSSSLPPGHAERCLRASVNEDLCHGFFVSAFVRESSSDEERAAELVENGGKGEVGLAKRRKRKRRDEGRQHSTDDIGKLACDETTNVKPQSLSKGSVASGEVETASSRPRKRKRVKSAGRQLGEKECRSSVHVGGPADEISAVGMKTPGSRSLTPARFSDCETTAVVESVKTRPEMSPQSVIREMRSTKKGPKRRKGAAERRKGAQKRNHPRVEK